MGHVQSNVTDLEAIAYRHLDGLPARDQLEREVYAALDRVVAELAKLRAT